LGVSILLLLLSDRWLVIDDSPLKKADLIIVLGYPAKEDGTPTITLQSRLDHGISLFQNEKAPLIFFSGAAVANDIVEAESMHNYAISKGIPTEHILLDPKANNTIQNLHNAYQLVLERNFNKVIIVSSAYHTRRANKIAASYDWDVQLAPVPYPGSIGYIGRIKAMVHECMAWVYYSWYGWNVTS